MLGGGGGFPPSSLWKIGLHSVKEAVGGLQDHDKDPQLMDRGVRVLAPLMALASSQVGSLPSLATLASLCGHIEGPWLPWKCWRASWVGETRATLTVGSCPTLALQELGWLSSSRLPAMGQEGSWGQTLEMTTALFTSSGPGHWHTLSRMAQAWGLAAWGSG